MKRNNIDILCGLMVEPENVEAYKRDHLPDQVLGDLVHHIDSLYRKVREARKTLVRLNAGHLRGQLGEEHANAAKCRDFCMSLNLVNNQLVEIEGGTRVQMQKTKR